MQPQELSFVSGKSCEEMTVVEKRIEISAPDSFTHRVSPLDASPMLYGNFIGVQFAFESVLDAALLAQSIWLLVKEFPALTGVYDAKKHAAVPAPPEVHLTIRENVPGAASNHAKAGTMQADRCAFVVEPPRRDVLLGRAPLSSFTLTRFYGGGCIFGMGVSHGLVDAAGFHLLARRLSEIYTALNAGTPVAHKKFITRLDVFEFGIERSRAAMLEALKEHGLAPPMRLQGFPGGLLKSALVRALKFADNNTPVVIHLSRDQVSRLKRAVLEESGEDWISTNVALCAHFGRIMAKLTYGDKPKTTARFGQVLDLRGRYFEDERAKQNQFAGNAILIHSEKETFPDGVQNASRGDLARFFKRAFTNIGAGFVRERIDLVADCLAHGYNYPGLEMRDPMISFNNQTKMTVYDIAFAGAAPTRIIPQDVGDVVMFFPTPDGGVEAYLRDIRKPGRQEALLTDEWRETVFGF